MKLLVGLVFCAVFAIASSQKSNNLVDPCKTKSRTAPHENQCDAYYECYDGQPYVQHCPNGLVYHEKRTSGLLGVCDYDFNVDCSDRPQRSFAQRSTVQEDPCKHQHGVVSDLTYCDRYSECVNDQAQLYDCPNGLVFVGRNRGIAEGCDYPWRGSYCQAPNGGEKQRANGPQSTEHCDWLYGIFGHETSCTRYWTCWNGTATEQFCIGGLLYNEDTHACDWPQNVQGCQKHPLCKDDPNANVPLGQSCERYWSCQGGYPRLQRCPATLVFDKISRRCVNPPTADCEAPTTVAPTEEESAFRFGGGPPRQNNPNRRRNPPRQDQQPAQQQVRQNVFTQQQPQQQTRVNSFNQPQQQQFQQSDVVEQPEEEFFEEPVEQVSQPRPQPRPARPSQGQGPAPRPRRPQISLADLPAGAIPAGATPIIFPRNSGGGNLRPAPIEGAIPLN